MRCSKHGKGETLQEVFLEDKDSPSRKCFMTLPRCWSDNSRTISWKIMLESMEPQTTVGEAGSPNMVTTCSSAHHHARQQVDCQHLFKQEEVASQHALLWNRTRPASAQQRWLPGHAPNWQPAGFGISVVQQKIFGKHSVTHRHPKDLSCDHGHFGRS